MRRELRCGDEGVGIISGETPARFCLTIGTDTFYFYYPVYDICAVPGTILTAIRQHKRYEFMRVSNGENPKWRITSIKDEDGFHTDHGERTANNLFGKILSRDKDNAYYIPSLPPNYSGLMLGVYKSNVEKKVLEFLVNLKNVRTEDKLRELVWELKYGSSVGEWIASPVNYLEKDSEETAIGIDGLPQINDIGVMIEINENKFTFKTDQGQLYLFSLVSKEDGNMTEQIEAKRGHWFYTFNRIKDTDKWRIVSKIREK